MTGKYTTELLNSSQEMSMEWKRGILAYFLDCSMVTRGPAHLKITFLQFHLQQVATL
jgi:hypothetical protein